ncbi:hypothetical protein GCM10027610_093190 [Dactylosporangium cerinum]
MRRARDAAVSHRRSASSVPRRSARVSRAQLSRRSTAPYPPAATGSAPGVDTTIDASPGTVARTPSRPDVRTGVSGNARASSSAVRRAPTTDARRRLLPHSGHEYAAATRPHHRHDGGAVADGSARGPEQLGQRDAV